MTTIQISEAVFDAVRANAQRYSLSIDEYLAKLVEADPVPEAHMHEMTEDELIAFIRSRKGKVPSLSKPAGHPELLQVESGESWRVTQSKLDAHEAEMKRSERAHFNS